MLHLLVRSRLRSLFCPFVGLMVSSLILGCGAGSLEQQGGASGALAVAGKAFGGSQPITGASIQLFAAGASGYGSASSPLLTQTVTSGAGGAFTLTGSYSCPSSNTPVYLTAREGNPGLTPGTNNTAITEMVALGNCGDLSSTTFINVNELTTVASVWALAPFMAGFDHVGTSTTNASGLANAFAMAANLVSSSSGQSPGVAPAGSYVPVAKLHTLANALASCVNSFGGVAGDGTPCGKLFTAATPAGGSAPTEIVLAAHNIAANPATHVNDIFTLASATSPYQPQVSTTPNDWTIAVNFSAGATQASDLAIDGTGNVWVATSSALYELSPFGSVAGTFPNMAGSRVTLDPAGNIWVGSGADGTMTLIKMAATLGAPTAYTHAAVGSLGGYNFSGLAADGLGNIWYTCDYCSALSKSDAFGSYVGSFSVNGSQHATNVSIDTGENVWVGNYDYSLVNVFTNLGVIVQNAPFSCGTCGYPASIANDGAGNAWITGYNLTRMNSTGGFTNYATNPVMNGGLFSPAGVAIDGAGNAWVSNSTGAGGSPGSLTLITSSGVPVSPSLGYLSDTLQSPNGLAVDGSGNIWVLNSGTSLDVFVGAAVPVVTPFATGIKNHKLGSTP